MLYWVISVTALAYALVVLVWVQHLMVQQRKLRRRLEDVEYKLALEREVSRKMLGYIKESPTYSYKVPAKWQ